MRFWTAVVFAFILTITSLVHAADTQQVYLGTFLSQSLQYNASNRMTASLMYSGNTWDNSQGITGLIGYNYQMADWGFISGKVGGVGSFGPLGQSAGIIAGRGGANVGPFNFQLRIDTLLNPIMPTLVHPYLGLNYSFFRSENLRIFAGGQIESYNAFLNAGPHLGLEFATQGCGDAETFISWLLEVRHSMFSYDDWLEHWITVASSVSFGHRDCKKGPTDY